ncbi:MAG: polysaccharide biosynthesis protein [Clostridia bacterium]|nr:polysaccharide biosynthesis protein [Clostridia bacterium]
MKSESFFKGTLILITANAVSKILGAVLKIPLTYILGEQGMAIYQTAFSVYIMLLSLITSGLPFAISRYVSEEKALKRYGNIRFATKFSFLLMFGLGLLASLIMFFGADFFALSMKDPKAVFAIKAIAPSIFFVAIGCVYKSCYQGYACQTPTAISQVIEALVKLIFGYLLASWFSNLPVKYTSSAAIFGVTIGEAVATLILFLLYIPYRKNVRFERRSASRRKIAKKLIGVAIPMTACALVSGLLGLLDASVIRSQLANITFSESSAKEFVSLYSPYTDIFATLSGGGKLSLDGARWLYGAYSGYAATVFNLPSGILASFGVAILPVVSGGIISKNYARLNKTVSAAAKTILLISLPASFVLVLFSKEILYILFKNTASHLMLSAMAPILVFSTLSQFYCSVLHAGGSIMTPFRYVTVCNLIKIALTYILIPIGRLNILGAIVASFLANVLYFILNMNKIKKDFNMSPVSFFDFGKIFASATLMVLVAYLLLHPLNAISGTVYIGFFVAILVAVFAYALSLILFGAIKKEEITHFRG